MKTERIRTFIENYSEDGDLVILKIEPVPRCCCCSGCLPSLWVKINEEIYPQGPIRHEDYAILKFQDKQIVLEQHESGPELLAFLESINTMSEFIKTLLSVAINSFVRKKTAKVKITKRTITSKQKLVDELILEIDTEQYRPKELGNVIRKIIEK